MKVLKKISALVLGLLLAFFLSPKSLAEEYYEDEFYSLDISVDIDKKGVASIKEVWDTVDQEGTEKYKPIGNLGKIKIEDFKAMVNGQDFTRVETWDVHKSFEEKAYKYGINETDEGLELCWGISNYGHNIHEITYKVNPIVIGLKDYDMVFWKFINDSMSLDSDHAKITIKGFEPFDESVKMWGFGMVGDIHNIDGSIVMESSGQVSYGIVLLRFPKGYFDTSYKIRKNFDFYAKLAQKGSDWEREYNDKYILGVPKWVPVVALLALVFWSSAIEMDNKSDAIIDRFDRKNKLPKAKKLKDLYYHQVPYENHIENLFILVKKAYPDLGQENMMDAFILKRIYQGNIYFQEEESFFFKKKYWAIHLISTPQNMGKVEKSFFIKLERIAEESSKDQISLKGLQKYMKARPTEIKKFFDSFYIQSTIELEKESYLSYKKGRRFLRKTYYYNPTQEGIELYTNLVKFKNYLEDYSLLSEREVNEVKLWDYYMIYAAMFGISKEVFRNLQKTYPEYASKSAFNIGTIAWSRAYASQSSSTYSSFYSSGSGGSTSTGGGGGSFGGGSGGGSR